MESLVLDGKRYVKAAVAAAAAGYTPDYVGQLCRRGAISAQLVGRSWYVQMDELKSHRSQKKRISRQKAREQVRLAVKEEQEKQTDTSRKHFEERHITYEGDTTELIPEVKKLTVASSKKKEKKSKKQTGPEYAPSKGKYVVENKGDQVQMSGTLDVVDVTDELFAGQDTVVLSPTVTVGKKKEQQTAVEQKEADEAKTDIPLVRADEEEVPVLKLTSVEVEQIESEEDAKLSFLSRIEAMNSTEEQEQELESVAEPDSVEEEVTDIPVEEKGGAVVGVGIVAISILVSLSIMALETSHIYALNQVGELEILQSRYTFDTQYLLDKIGF